MQFESKQRRQAVTTKEGKLGSISGGRVTFVGYDPLFEETVVDTGFMAVYGCRFCVAF